MAIRNTLWESVYCALKHLSPQQVSGTLARMDTPELISHETIYTAIYAMPKGEPRQEVSGPSTPTPTH